MPWFWSIILIFTPFHGIVGARLTGREPRWVEKSLTVRLAAWLSRARALRNYWRAAEVDWSGLADESSRGFVKNEYEMRLQREQVWFGLVGGGPNGQAPSAVAWGGVGRLQYRKR